MSDGDMVKILLAAVITGIIVVVVLFAYGGGEIIADAVEAWHDAVPTPTPTPTPVIGFKEVVKPIVGGLIIFIVCVIVLWILWSKFGPDAGF